MSTYKITLIPGDGIGPEIVAATVAILESTGIFFEWETIELNPDLMKQSETGLARVVDAIKRTKVAIKGPISTPVGGGFTSPNVSLRKLLGLYASIRPAKSLPGIALINKPLDVIVVRENTEDVYVGIEESPEPGKVIAQKVITRSASERVARCAFKLAVVQGRRKVTALHKADILKLSDGLFLESCRAVAKEFDEIQYEEAIIDSACMQLIVDPACFDVIVTMNMYGDIVSDITAGLIGGLGLAGSMNMGDGIAVYEAVHGSAPGIAGKGIANPTGLLMASVMMLRNLGETQASKKLNKALVDVLSERIYLTADLGGSATTNKFKDAVISKLKS
jgi:isocitrate dehydrogenase (NAD+)